MRWNSLYDALGQVLKWPDIGSWPGIEKKLQPVFSALGTKIQIKEAELEEITARLCQLQGPLIGFKEMDVTLGCYCLYRGFQRDNRNSLNLRKELNPKVTCSRSDGSSLEEDFFGFSGDKGD
ncbi:hypothetical protein J437_LFUL014020 [Ladona fulva]|uniref:Uncharacterized protein n=1 Tax=Ladona fulva TaxID=123851 RepID=A0A8K0KFW9_LADFU|nr:hypothetical protein J437_LFUL014020 [Ladona fulva]